VAELLDCALKVEPNEVGALGGFCPVLVLLLWVVAAPALYCPVAGWSVLDALYFACMTMLTVGQVAVLPATADLRWWTVLYILFGVGIVAWIWVSVGVRLLVRHEAAFRSVLTARDHANLLAAEGCGPHDSDAALEDLVVGDGGFVPPSVPEDAVSMEASAYCESTGDPGAADTATDGAYACRPASIAPTDEGVAGQSKRDTFASTTACFLAPLVIMLLGAAFVYAGTSVASFADALYWSVLTCTTVGANGLGLGLETSRKTNHGFRLFTLVFALIAVPSCLASIVGVVELALRAHASRFEREVGLRSLPWDFLVDLDADGAGVGRLEFLCASLMVRDKASAHDLWLVLDEFQRLDFDGAGVLNGAKLAALRRGTDKCAVPGRRRGFAATAAREAVGANPPEHRDSRLLRSVSIFAGEGDVSPVAMPIDPSVASPSDVRSGHRQSMVHFAPSVGEVFTSEAPSAFRDRAHANSASAGEVLCSEAPSSCRDRTNVSAGEVLATKTSAPSAIRDRAHANHTSVGEVLRSEAPSSCRDRTNVSAGEILTMKTLDVVDCAGMTSNTPVPDNLVHQFYQDTLVVRRRLEQKDAELVVAMRTQQQTESNLRQVVAERQALYGEVLLLKRTIAELQPRFEEQQKLRAEAEHRCAELEARCREAESQMRRQQEALGRACEESARTADALRKRCVEAQDATTQAEARAEAAEQRTAESVQWLKTAQEQWKIVNDRKMREISLQCAELDMKRQNEIRSALLELHIASQGQHDMRTDAWRTRPPPALTQYMGLGEAPLKQVHPGPLRCEALDLPVSAWASTTGSKDSLASPQIRQQRKKQFGLLAGHLREQAAFLSGQVQKLAERDASSEERCCRRPDVPQRAADLL